MWKQYDYNSIYATSIANAIYRYRSAICLGTILGAPGHGERLKLLRQRRRWLQDGFGRVLALLAGLRGAFCACRRRGVALLSAFSVGKLLDRVAGWGARALNSALLAIEMRLRASYGIETSSETSIVSTKFMFISEYTLGSSGIQVFEYGGRFRTQLQSFRMIRVASFQLQFRPLYGDYSMDAACIEGLWHVYSMT